MELTIREQQIIIQVQNDYNESIKKRKSEYRLFKMIKERKTTKHAK